MSAGDDYLLDTNTLSYWYRGEPSVLLAVAARSNSRMSISAITWGEIHQGHRLVQLAEDSPEQAQAIAWIRANIPYIHEIGASTAEMYGGLRARLCHKYGGRRRGTRYIESLTDPATGRALGIQENDLWICAQAIELNLVLVTGDRMTRIKEVSDELVWENWYDGPTAPPTPIAPAPPA